MRGKGSGGNNKIQMIGRHYYHLVVQKEVGQNQHGQLLYQCKCTCGNICIWPGHYLRQGRKRSCGCKNTRRCGKLNPRWTGHGEIGGAYWHRTKQGARVRNLTFDITIQYAWRLFLRQHRRCTLTGQLLYFCDSDANYRHNSKSQTASLDRINSQKGYIKGNLRWVHKDVNCLKGKMSDDKFIKICKQIAKYN